MGFTAHRHKNSLQFTRVSRFCLNTEHMGKLLIMSSPQCVELYTEKGYMAPSCQRETAFFMSRSYFRIKQEVTKVIAKGKQLL